MLYGCLLCILPMWRKYKVQPTHRHSSLGFLARPALKKNGRAQTERTSEKREGDGLRDKKGWDVIWHMIRRQRVNKVSRL